MCKRKTRTARRGLAGAAVGLALAATFAAADPARSLPAAVERTEAQQTAGYWGWPETTCPYAGCAPR